MENIKKTNFERFIKKQIGELYQEISDWEEELLMLGEHYMALKGTDVDEDALEVLDELIEGVNQKIRRASIKIEKLEELKDKSTDIVLIKSPKKTNNTKFLNGLSINMGWIESIRYFLNRSEKYLTANDIMKLSIANGKNLVEGTKEYDKAKSSLYAVLKIYTTRKELKRLKLPGVVQHYYGLIDWFDGDSPIDKYLPIKNED